MKLVLSKITFFSLFTTSLFFASCDNNNNDRANTDNYNKFVTRVEGERDKWDTDTAYWTNVERENDSLSAAIDANYNNLDETGRKEIDDIRTRYDKTRGEYMTAREQKAAAAASKNTNRETELRTMIWGAEASADLSNVNGTNIRSYYEKLVQTVKQNKDSYTPDDWDAIKAWYEKLDAMKNQFEGKDLSGKDNLAIAKLKVEYDAIAKTQRIDSKIEQKIDEQAEKRMPGN